MKFSEKENTVFFRAKRFMEIWYLLMIENFLVLNFWEMGNTFFFDPKSWWKDEIYWLLKSFCFKLFGDRKYGLFWAKTLMEWWYLLITEKFLFWTFQWWEIGSFFQRKCSWKDDIYLVFLSIPWYSRTWQTWFFV